MDSTKRARLEWRCRRGMRELDVLLMRYMERDYERASAEEQAAFETLLTFQDPEILDLLTGRLSVQDRRLQDVVERLLSND